MRKYLKLILSILIILTIFLVGNSVKAATASLSSSSSVEEGDTIKVTVTVNAAQWNLSLTANGKTIDSWTETVNYKENLSKTFTASYKASEKGSVNFVLKGDITDVDRTNKDINTSKSVTVNEKVNNSNSEGNSSSNNNTNSNTNNNTNSNSNNSNSNTNSNNSEEEPKKPTFKENNKTVYTTGSANLRASWSTSSKATAVEKGTELKLTGTSSEKVNGYTWYRVEYNGATRYIASSLVTETKPDEDDENTEKANLKSLTIEGISLNPTFSPNITQYNAKLEENVKELKVDAKAENSKAKVEVEGNDDLKDGENVITITVTTEDDITKTYTVNVTKGEGEPVVTSEDDDGSLKLSELKIVGVNFDNVFKPDLYSYELNLNLQVKDLNITAVANQEDAQIEILGNENFQAGENVVTILLTSSDGLQTATYQIKVNVPGEETAAQKDLQLYLICGGLIVLAIILLIVFLIIHKKNRSNEEAEDDEYVEQEKVEDIVTEEKLPEDKEEYNTEGQTVESEKKNIKEEKKATLDEFLDTSELDEKPKRSRGKHSM